MRLPAMFETLFAASAVYGGLVLLAGRRRDHDVH
jgi:hypothetical protein